MVRSVRVSMSASVVMSESGVPLTACTAAAGPRRWIPSDRGARSAQPTVEVEPASDRTADAEDVECLITGTGR
jgi:hypothetical protein